MRTTLPLAVTALLLFSALPVQAGGGCTVAAPTCGADGNAGGAACCRDGCGQGHCGLFGRGCGAGGIDGLDPHFNCGCRGSYNYPVPPQYTYHWPGMYKQNLMTDYTSPWRFPPLKPYVDEQPVQAADALPLPTLQTISAEIAIGTGATRSGQIEPMSSRLSRVR
jgi:hypothetical protein